jgi:competence protein ComEA
VEPHALRRRIGMIRTLFTAITVVALCAAASIANASQSTAAAKTPANPAAKRAAKTVTHPAGAVGPININTASSGELETLPGIGAKTAARIVEYRVKNGPYKKVEELMNVRGVGEKNFLKLRTQLTVGAPRSEHAGPPQ